MAFTYQTNHHNRLIRDTVAVFIFSVCFAGQAAVPFHPQFEDPFLDPLSWTHFDALDNKGFICFAEAPDQTLWFGLQDGVMQTDGYDRIKHELTDGLVPGQILGIHAARNGIIYVCNNEGVSRYQNGRWTRLDLPLDDRESGKGYRFSEFRDGSVWLGTQYGLLQFHNEKIVLYNRDRILRHAPEDTANALKQTFQSDRYFYVYEVYQDNDGEIWFAEENAWIYRCSYENGSLAPFDHWRIYRDADLAVADGVKFTEMEKGVLLVSDFNKDHGLFQFDKKENRWSKYDLVALGGKNIINSMVRLHGGGILLSAQNECYLFRNGSMKRYRMDELNLPSGTARLLQSSDQAIWVGGVMDKVFRLDYSMQRYKKFIDIHFQCESIDGLRWYLHKDGSVISQNINSNVWTRYGQEDGIPEIVTTVFVTNRNRVLAAGSHERSAALAYLEEDRWIRHLYPDLGLFINYNGLTEGPHSMLYIGNGANLDWKPGALGGFLIARFNQKQQYKLLEHMIPPDHAYPTRISGIARSSDGKLWFGGSSLRCYDPQKRDTVNLNLQLSGDWVDDLIVTREDVLWFSQGGIGVFRNDGQTWKKFTESDGLASNRVSFLFEDTEGLIWAGSNNGISRFDGNHWVRQVLPASFSIPRETGTIAQSRDGAMWFNFAHRDWYLRALYPISDSDINFYSYRYFSDAYPPKTRFLEKPGEVPFRQPVVISWEGTDRYHDTPKDALEYAYRLDNETWSEWSHTNFVTLQNLKEGHHILEVRARDRDLNVEPTPASMQFHVNRPLWQQAWFVGVMVSIAVLLVYLETRIILRDRELQRLNTSLSDQTKELRRVNSELIRANAERINNALKVQRIEAHKEHEFDQKRLQFLTNISHEFKTPLSLMQNYIDKLKAALPHVTPVITSTLENMKKNNEVLLRLSNQMLDYWKSESERLRLEITYGDFIQFVRNIHNIFQTQAENQQITMQFETEIQSLYTWFDPEKMETVFYNLLSNALKFTDSNGKIRIRILRKKPAHDSDMLIVKITDSGPGINRAHLPHIFDRYYRAASVTPGKEGAGIGLSLTKKLVELHYGQINVHSEKGQGTEFILSFPLDNQFLARYEESEERHILENHTESVDAFSPPHENQSLTDSVSTEMTAEDTAKPVLLIIEDSDDLRGFIRDELESEYYISEAGDGRPGLKMARQIIPDLIISDIKMPGMGGLDLCEQIRGDDSISHIPVILLTAHRDKDFRMKSFEVGADAFINKPFSIQELRLRIRNLISAHRKMHNSNHGTDDEKTTADINWPYQKKFIDRARQITRENMESPEFCVESLAEMMCMSRSQLFRKFKSVIDQSPSEFIRRERLKRAGVLLKQTDMNVSEIMYQVGFVNHGNFYKIFTSYYGTPPSKYAKS